MPPRFRPGRPLGLALPILATAAVVATSTIVAGTGTGASASYLPVAATSQAMIRTEIGGPGSGPARNLSIDAFDVALDRQALLVVDNGHDVLRSIDVRTGRATVLAGTGVAG